MIFQHFAHVITVLQLILLPMHTALDADVCFSPFFFSLFEQTAVVEEGRGRGGVGGAHKFAERSNHGYFLLS